MMSLKKTIFRPFYLVCAFFFAVFLCLILFNPFHIIYQEQLQLFRFNWHYFTDFLTKPGGFSEYTGAFFTQFFINPLVGAAIITLAGYGVFALSAGIFRNFKIYGVLWSIIPILLLIVLHGNHLFKLSYTIGFLLALVFIYIYTSIEKQKSRLVTGFICWIILYLATGAFSIFAMIICILYEWIITKNPHRFITILSCVFLASLFPLITWRYIYIIPFPDVWFRPLSLLNDKITKGLIFVMLIYYPLLITIMSILLRLLKKQQISFTWNWKNILAGIIIIFAFTAGVKRYLYDPKMEMFLGIDHYIQKSEWDKALELCSAFPEINRLTIYFTNLALLKSGQLPDRMFHYTQLGTEGLSLPFALNDFIPFFGCEIYYHLGFVNEAYHWAFEANVANGNCPRLLKRLTMTSLINGDLKIAEKYLNLLKQTLFYRAWAKNYLKMLNEPELLLKDKEIREKRFFLMHDDFFAGDVISEFGLARLLQNNPYNRMAYEYLMAYLLLNKDLASFAENIKRLRDFGYKEIPVHYEEALLFLMGYTKKYIIPEGFFVRESTSQRFKNYVKAFISSDSPELKARTMKVDFGMTFWYYYNFVKIQDEQDK